MALALSHHAGIRAMQRGISREHLCAALCGWQYCLPDGSTLWTDRRSRVTVVVKPDGGVATVMRLQTKRMKAYAGWRVI